MPGIQTLDFDSPDETRTPDKTRVDVVRVGNATAARLTFEPGWTWDGCVKPVAGGESCQLQHLWVVKSGRLVLTHDDGTELEVGPGDVYAITPGHVARVPGDEPFVVYEFEPETAAHFAEG
jgi:mannose-6-phosphate isomerase-like protein (cupin superfamily)